VPVGVVDVVFTVTVDVFVSPDAREIVAGESEAVAPSLTTGVTTTLNEIRPEKPVVLVTVTVVVLEWPAKMDRV